MKKYNVPQIELYVSDSKADIITFSDPLSRVVLKESGEGNKWTVSQTATDRKVSD